MTISCCNTEPSPPLDVMATVTSSTTINVTWSEPSVFNGIIRHYVITFYETSKGTSSNITQQVNPNLSSVQLSSLTIYTNYTIFVQAVTVARSQPSNSITIQTDEDGKNVISLSFVLLDCHMYTNKRLTRYYFFPFQLLQLQIWSRLPA